MPARTAQAGLAAPQLRPVATAQPMRRRIGRVHSGPPNGSCSQIGTFCVPSSSPRYMTSPIRIRRCARTRRPPGPFSRSLFVIPVLESKSGRRGRPSRSSALIRSLGREDVGQTSARPLGVVVSCPCGAMILDRADLGAERGPGVCPWCSSCRVAAVASGSGFKPGEYEVVQGARPSFPVGCRIDLPQACQGEDDVVWIKSGADDARLLGGG